MTRTIRASIDSSLAMTNAQLVDKFDMNGKGWVGSKLSGVSAGETWLSKYDACLFRLRRAELFPRCDDDAVRSEQRQQRLVAICLLVQHFQDDASYREQASTRVPLAGERVFAVLDQRLAAKHPHAFHEKLVQIRRHDRKELEPFEQWRALIERLVQDAFVECEPPEVAIEPGMLEQCLAVDRPAECGLGGAVVHRILGGDEFS